tara:strand:- start:283 stop:864 length:582 start_codon:yes stop_codon:yes gene_type:complete
MMTIPIPHRPSGFLLGDPAAQTIIDIFIDIQCPYSRLIWTTVLDVLKHYQGKSLSINIHLITVSSHRQAWDINLGLFALAEGNAVTFSDFVTYIYARQEQFYNAPFMHKTHEDLRNLILRFAQQHAEVDPIKFLNRMNDDDIYGQARTPIRYAAIRSVWATPTVFINNATDVPIDHNSRLADWKSVIDPLLAS